MGCHIFLIIRQKNQGIKFCQWEEVAKLAKAFSWQVFIMNIHVQTDTYLCDNIIIRFYCVLFLFFWCMDSRSRHFISLQSDDNVGRCNHCSSPSPGGFPFYGSCGMFLYKPWCSNLVHIYTSMHHRYLPWCMSPVIHSPAWVLYRICNSHIMDTRDVWDRSTNNCYTGNSVHPWWVLTWEWAASPRLPPQIGMLCTLYAS